VVAESFKVTKEGVAPLRRYHRLRRRVLGLSTYRLFDVFVPLVEHTVKYPYDDVGAWIVDSVSPLGATYQQHVKRAFDGRWIDVFENSGKRSGAYSAPVRTCCSITTRRSMRSSRSRTRWATRCTRCCRTRRSRSSMRATRSSWRKCRRRSTRRSSST